MNFGPANTSSVIGATQSFGGSWTTPQTISPAQVVAGEFPKVSDDATGYGVAVWGNHTLLELQSAHWTPAPTVLNVNPNSGPIAGGNTVTITGTNFTNFQDVTTLSVTFGIAPSSFMVTSRSTISAVVPPESATLFFAKQPVQLLSQLKPALEMAHIPIHHLPHLLHQPVTLPGSFMESFLEKIILNITRSIACYFMGKTASNIGSFL